MFFLYLWQYQLEYRSLYDRVTLDLKAAGLSGGTDPNAALTTTERLDRFYGSSDLGMVELLFNYGRYLLIASSQPGGQPANLQGVWNAKPLRGLEAVKVYEDASVYEYQVSASGGKVVVKG